MGKFPVKKLNSRLIHLEKTTRDRLRQEKIKFQNSRCGCKTLHEFSSLSTNMRHGMGSH